jgi:hypothetical protein
MELAVERTWESRRKDRGSERHKKEEVEEKIRISGSDKEKYRKDNDLWKG